MSNNERFAPIYKYRLSTAEMHEIIDMVAAGARVSDICKKFTISQQFLHQWRKKDTLFGQRFDEARKAAAESMVESLTDIAKDAVTPTDVAIASLKSNNIKWIASKHNREQYGEKMEMNIHQTLDISGILKAAEARIGPILDQSELKEIQTIETIAEYNDIPTGLEPVVPTKKPESIDDLL